MKLYSPIVVKEIIRKYNFRFRKSLGQNFLIDGNIVSKIVDTAEVGTAEAVLEIGPGIGTLTGALAERAAKVVAVELDKNLLPVLQETLEGYNNIEIFSGNALKINFDDLMLEKTNGVFGRGARPYKVVANLPYYITTPLIMHSMESHFNISLMVFMVQKEVAERMSAAPGGKDYGALTLGVNYYSQPKLAFKIPRTVFIPQPEVDSAVVSFKIREKPPSEVEDEKTFFSVVKAAFGQRRKTLPNNLIGMLKGRDKNEIAELLSQLGIDPARRGETLSFDEFARLSNKIYRLL
jgi:16S rRNA (adenine1518-N6/adenine1519-N6)-dimethyltransferase